MIEIAGELSEGALIAGPSDTRRPWRPRFDGCALQRRTAESGDGRSRGPRTAHHLLGRRSGSGDRAGAARCDLSASSGSGELAARRPRNLLQDEVAAIRGAKSFGRSPSAGEGGLASDALVRHVAIVGSVAECRERVREIVALGPEEVTFRLPAGDRMATLKGTGGGGVGGVRGPLPPHLPLGLETLRRAQGEREICPTQPKLWGGRTEDSP